MRMVQGQGCQLPETNKPFSVGVINFVKILATLFDIILTNLKKKILEYLLESFY